MACVFYFRGLNTYAEDHVRLGPLRAGTMHGPLQVAFQEHDIQFVPLLGMQTGRLQETISRARELLLRHPIWSQSESIHFLGHSTGALIARALVHDSQIKPKIRSLLTIGAPHLGAPAADLLQEMAQKKSQWLKVAQFAGWDWSQRQKIIGDLSPSSVNNFNQQYPDLPQIRYASLVCACPKDQLSLVMQFFAKVVDPPSPNDGLIPVASQTRGEIAGEYQLDHFTQLGYFPFINQSHRKNHQREFRRMIQDAVNFWNTQ